MRKYTTLPAAQPSPGGLCALVMGGFCTQANAAFEPAEPRFLTKMEDNDYETVIKGNGNTGGDIKVEVGDFLVAIV